jgi:hypothetical protein
MRSGDGEGPVTDVLAISCDTCAVRASAACDDCLVTFLCEERGSGAGPGGAAIVLDLTEQRAVRMLAAAGLVPTIRHRATG